MDALRTAATGMAAQQTRVDVIANNISNMSTTAYAPRSAVFADLIYRQDVTPGALSSRTGTIVPAGVQLGLGVRTAAIAMDIGQGGLRASGGDLDLAIEGRGFFEVELPSGEQAFTRDGKFEVSADGQVVTSSGFPLADGITVPREARKLTITPDGEVMAEFTDGTPPQSIGVITLSSFVNERGLEALGSNLYRATEASGDPNPAPPGLDGNGFIRQGYLEESGVDVVSEIADLIEAQRGYELNSKVLTAADEMYAAATRIR
ncbi:flagellar basal-body rod protein FlgG [Parvularcula dongshanensis]|uniref:Flagellar basal-body rod protein FlgG n=1 Tax=Parvularcula dongshanensis TaxID=1173995 RepID=A0A840I6K1_9PROT|nr:flagellar basal-body rod protein FlgG [Parvularcula dongshanensis]MBB4659630.1 flagellar basal-body rod protein FlgG [Parvularcula dongshanensis]